jgi:hypothetical protein
MKRFLREPLLHFALGGTLLFAAYTAMNGHGPGNNTIVVTAGQIEHLATGFTRSWRRPPTADELRDLVSGYIREEVYYREAKDQGLDRNDPVIRRRLQQKLEFLTQDTAAESAPADTDLNAMMNAEADKFRIGRSFAFAQVYLNPQNHSDPGGAATRLLRELTVGHVAPDQVTAGDRFLLGSTFDLTSAEEIGKLFGADFAERLGQLEPGAWQGPVKSGYGMHLVFVTKRTEGRLPDLAEVRDAVLREWKEKQRSLANDDAYRRLLSRYSIRIETPGTEPDHTAALAKP